MSTKPTYDPYNTESVEPTKTAPVNLSEKALKERSYDLTKLTQISRVRESAHPQFDGMGYMKYNETNEMADISYLAPKVNKYDSRITTGITHEKSSSLVSMFTNFKFEGIVRVFKGDKELQDMGTSLSNWARHSREKEEYDNKRGQFYRNLVSQGTSFSCERYVERYVPKKIVSGEVDFTDLNNTEWVEKGDRKLFIGCESDLVDPKKVFLEDIRQPDIQKQPGVYTVEYVPRELMETIWGKSKMWKSVPHMVTPVSSSLGTLTQGSIYSDWIFGEVDFNKVEVIQVYRPFEQRYQIYINGIPMLSPGFPLTAISPSGLIPIAKGDIDLMNMFAYSKSIPAKTKIDQAVMDTMLKVLLIKFQQSATPPTANNTGRVVDAGIYMPGRSTVNIDPKKLTPLLEATGVTNADFGFYNTIKEQIDSKSVSSLLEGQATKDMTLGQYMDQQKKAMLKVGGMIDGIVNWEKQMLRLRIANLLVNGPSMNDKDEYEDVTFEEETEAGTQKNIIRFDEENYDSKRDSWDVLEEQIKYGKENGDEASITYINPKMMREMLLDPEVTFYYEVVPVEKNNDKLSQMMFIQMITQAANLFGMDSLAVERLKKRYARTFNEQFEDIFLNEDEMELEKLKMQQEMLKQQPQGAEQGQEALAAPGGNPMQGAGEQAPSMTDAMNQ